jgi:uncharacterized protein YutE (UPF0331/DUF86 family)
MIDDIVLNKKESIERCVKQIRTYYNLSREIPYEEDYLVQDAIALNLQRACELSIDLANHTVRARKLGLPKESKESFRLLAENGIIPKSLALKMESMVGFRNVLVHQYEEVNHQIMIDIIENHLDDLIEYTNYILDLFQKL